ncbi:hypothetical protein Igag_1682 [Ignisphaera aggregans DSM 17230]|uniref:Uncharacterized protein n=1 Tax=Ignisphaera aggregans (strain DSM 17230 / JCM 13409 / AQ1.S1) TaxID=583356 RepID=E0SRU8_IGNAA|nr:hypothetical protein Igag_1682 [Ignisphaera aggregans DSM 17230]
MRGISKFLVLIMLIGITIVIAVAAIALIQSYIQSLWKPEMLRIIEARIIYRDNSYYLYLYMANDGDVRAEIYKIEIYQMETRDVNIAIDPHKEASATIPLEKEYTLGTTYRARLYLKTGTIYFKDITITS